MYVEGGGKKRRVGGDVFIKTFRGGAQFDRKVYFKRGSLAKMGKAVKQ